MTSFKGGKYEVLGCISEGNRQNMVVHNEDDFNCRSYGIYALRCCGYNANERRESGCHREEYILIRR